MRLGPKHRRYRGFADRYISPIPPIGGAELLDGIGIGFAFGGMGIPPPQHPLAGADPIGMADFPPVAVDAGGIVIGGFPPALAGGIGIAVGPPPVAVDGVARALFDAAGGGDATVKDGSTAGRAAGPVGPVASLLGSCIIVPPFRQLAVTTPNIAAMAIELKRRFMKDPHRTFGAALGFAGHS